MKGLSLVPDGGLLGPIGQGRDPGPAFTASERFTGAKPLLRIAGPGRTRYRWGLYEHVLCVRGQSARPDRQAKWGSGVSRNRQSDQNARASDDAAAEQSAAANTGASETEPPPTTISNMSYSEMVGFYNQQLSRVELAWFRIMYLHAAVVGVLVFFGEAEDFLFLQRFIVFGFFSVNLAIFHVALSEGYAGLTEALKDLKRFPENDGHVDRWFRRRRSLYQTKVRTAIIMVTWTLVAFLLFQSLVFA